MPILLLLAIVTASPASADVVDGGVLTVGTAVTGAVGVANRDIQYTFAGMDGVHASFDVTATNWGSGTAQLYVYTPSGVLYITCALASAPTFCEFTPNVTGTWRAQLDPVSTAVGSATFKLDADQSKGALTSGTPIATTIASKGVNANYTFAGTIGTHVSLAVKAASWGGGSASLYIFPPSGTPLYFSCAVLTSTLCEFTPDVTGTWHAMLDPVDATIGSTTFTLANDQAKGALRNGRPISTTITTRGQNASYTFAGKNGVHQTVDVTASNWGSGKARLYVYQPSGTLYSYCTLGKKPSYCDFVPNVTGSWRLVLDPQGNAVGRTTFSVTSDQARRAIKLNKLISTSISKKGQDAGYTFVRNNRKRVIFDVTATNWGRSHATLYFFRPDGSLYDHCAFSSHATRCAFTPDVTGTWKVKLDPYGSAVGRVRFKYRVG